MTAPAAYLKMAADGLITLPHLTTQIHSRTSGTAPADGNSEYLRWISVASSEVRWTW